MCVSLEYVGLHNVAETVPDGDGHLLQRIPEDVRTAINEGAQSAYREPAGVEVRFQADGTPAEVRLSAAGENRAIPYWGPLRAGEPVELGPEPIAVRVPRPDHLDDLGPGAVDSPFGTRCARIRFDPRGSPVRYHGVEPGSAVSPPEAALLPDRRLLAYGTSITQGYDASGPHLTYPAQATRRLGCDAVNLGTAGSAYCEPAIADHIADREWDVAVLALSVNMLGAGFPVETFRERASYFVDRVAATGRPVAAITLFPFAADVCNDREGAEATAYREALRDIVGDAPDNVRLIEGMDLLDPSGLTTDLTHPADEGMIGIGERLAAHLASLLDEG
jgi:lysophospholipase L1-like esterase